MPKIEIDYSNTIFYKIFCKDTNIKDLYVGLTTNFVQRKHAHKQSCKNEKAMNHNCKLYKAIRNAGGWDNWQMEIIAFHNCKDSHEAHKKEQEYFKMLGATLNSIEPLPKPKIKEPIAKNVKDKPILYCEPCNIYFSYWKAQETHNNTKKHHKNVSTYNNKVSMASQKSKKGFANFHCDTCEYNTCRESQYNRHIMTSKHLILTNTNKNVPKSSATEYKCDCGKYYIHASSLWNHKKKCIQNSQQSPEAIPSQDHDLLPTNIILELIKQNQEFKQLLVEQNKQLYEKHEENMGLQKQLLDVVKDGKTINNNTINNNNNKTFNLQVFLNETCKDAMNIKDFIQSLELTLTDLEKVGELGYAEGISRMFIKGLNNLDITKRPIHCSDVKREIMHIKHEDKWEKDNANQDKLKNIIKQLTHKNIMMLDDWKKANPGCTAYDSKKYDHYLKLTMESMGPTDEDAEKRDFNKIIRRVAENTTIDKKYLVV